MREGSPAVWLITTAGLLLAGCGESTPSSSAHGADPGAEPGVGATGAGATSGGGSSTAGGTPVTAGGGAPTVPLPDGGTGVLLPDGGIAVSLPDGGVVTVPAPGAEVIYDDAVVHTFDLTIAPADLAFLDADPAAEIYVPATFSFRGVDYAGVGVRHKGSGGSFNGCVEVRTSAPNRASGAKTCLKISMKVSFNWTDPEGRFFGLKKLLFHSMKNDPSLLRERLAYSTYRDHGVPASRSTHAMLRINGQNAGLWALVEEVDGRFTRDRFATEGGQGNLYKEIWPLQTTEPPYLAALQSNRDQAPSAARMVTLAQEIAAASDAELQPTIERWMDVDHVMRLIAVDRAVRADDGPFHWWCSTGGWPWTQQRRVGAYWCGNHNYLWYEETLSPRVWLLPWDMDATFRRNDAPSALNWNWNDTSLSCSLVAPGNIGNQWPPSCDRMIRGWTMYQAEFVASANELLDGPFSEAAVDEKLDRWVSQLRPIVEAGEVLDRFGLTTNTWLAEVDVLRNYIDQQRADLGALVGR